MDCAERAYPDNRLRLSFLNLSLKRFFGERGRKVEESQLKFYNDVADFYRSWEAQEGEIIDFDLTPRKIPLYEWTQKLTLRRPTQGERRARAKALIELVAHGVNLKVPPKEDHNHQFLLAKLGASSFFSRRLAGEPVEPPTYIRETIGVGPEEIPEAILLAQKQKVAALFEELGGGNYDEESLRSYYEKRLLLPEEMVRRIGIYGQDDLRAVGNFIGREINVAYATEVVDKNAYWFIWVDGKVPDFHFQINSHKRHRYKFTDGKAQAMALHEIAAHLGMMQQRAEFIRNGELHEVFGLTTVHDPEQVTLEGIAQTLNYFVPELNSGLTPEGKFEVELYGMRQMVYNNVHLQVISPDFTGSPEQLEGIIDYVQGYYPLESRENIIKEVNDRWKDPKLQVYRYSYGISFCLHRALAQGLSLEGRREFLKQLSGRPFTPAQEKKLYLQLQSNPRYRAAA